MLNSVKSSHYESKVDYITTVLQMKLGTEKLNRVLEDLQLVLVELDLNTGWLAPESMLYVVLRKVNCTLSVLWSIG